MESPERKTKWVRAGSVFFLLLVVSLGAAQQPGADKSRGEEGPILMRAEDGKTYLVKPEETLGAAMRRREVAAASSTTHHAALQAAPPPENGNCVPDSMEHKPEGSVGCKCYEVTECKGGEATQCKRHCKKDQCMCCSI